MSFAIISQIKISNLQGNLVHNLRTSPNLGNVDYSKSTKNITLENFKYKSQKDYLEKTKEKISKANKLNKTKNRMCQKGKAFSQEFVFTHSPGAMSEIESVEYLKAANEFIKDRFPNHEILSSVIHLDEKTPHVHINVSYFDDESNKFTQKEMMKSDKKLTDINEIRNAFQNKVADKFNLKKQDGSVVEAKNHQRSANKEIAELKEAQKKKDQELVDLQIQKIAFQEENTKLENQIEYKDLTISELKSKNVTETEAREALTTTNDTLIEEITTHKQSIVDLTNKNKELQEKTRKRQTQLNEIFKSLNAKTPILKTDETFIKAINEAIDVLNQNKPSEEQNEALIEESIELDTKTDSRPTIELENSVIGSDSLSPEDQDYIEGCAKIQVEFERERQAKVEELKF